ncbi:hypothetical protein F3Y22_tig00111754pilonHSYRG00095 [Hibiscus syriacus]|uniref:Protein DETOXIFICATION n=1 Tax=Hibiscus syriacus TaxID=106335 RepID=A0A6A2XFG0_HIBSY|nr:hypothetical protein F3Y22_tig00111754pilonHSYRG00095 [Hibiscus syriacus]
MSPSKSAERVALLAKGSHGNEETKERWWSMRRVLDLEEARHQLMLSLPMIISNISYDFITLVSVMFAGHLGELELAGATLADSWASVTGFALMIGLSGALETLCGQGFGAKSYRMLGLHLQASCIVSFFFSIIISILWFYSESIFICLHQDPQISKIAAMYLRHLIPGLFAYGFLQNILRFLQAQSVVMPLVWFSILPMVSHFGIVYILVNWTSTGVKGASMAASISLWILFVSLAMYVTCTKQLKQTWKDCRLNHFVTFYIPQSGPPFCSNELVHENEWHLYDSTRVANELGGGNPEKAKSAMAVTLKLSTILTLAIGLALAFGHNVWAAFFTDSSSIISRFASITPFLVVSITFGCFQDILSAVARGCGWQPLAAWVNLGTYYFIGIPIACLLGFMLKLYDKGKYLMLLLLSGVIDQLRDVVLFTSCLACMHGDLELSESYSNEANLYDVSTDQGTLECLQNTRTAASKSSGSSKPRDDGGITWSINCLRETDSEKVVNHDIVLLIGPENEAFPIE